MSVADETDYMGRDAAAKWLAKAEQRLTSRRHGPKGSKAVTKRRRKKISRRSHADTKTDQADGHIGDHLAGPITNNSSRAQVHDLALGWKSTVASRSLAKKDK